MAGILSKSKNIAFLIVVACVVWVASGIKKEEPNIVQRETKVSEPTPVGVTLVKAQEKSKDLTLYGTTKASKSLNVRVETFGRVDELAVKKGQKVEKGDLILKISAEDRLARVAEVKATVKQRQLEFQAAEKLAKKNFQATTQVAEAEALLEAAMARLKAATLDLEDTELHAPFSGIIQETHTEEGDFLNKGQHVVTLLALDPILMVAEVSENWISSINENSQGYGLIDNYGRLPGVVSYISRSANSETRTFQVELSAQNESYQIVDGLTVDIRIPLKKGLYHYIPSSILTISDGGEVGVQTVGQKNQVIFYPISIISEDRKGLWVDGLPHEVRLISTGQEYVRPGDIVKPVRN